MEFWGIEVKAGQPIKSDPGADYVIHLSQASLGEAKNKAESVPLYVNADGKKLVLGTLSHQNCPQLSFDLVFDQEFELSHNWKNGSVFFLGYKTYIPEEGDDFDISSEGSSDEEEIPLVAAENGKSKTDVKTAKTDARKPEAVKIAEPSKKTEDDDDDDDSEDESDSDDSDDSEDEDEPDEMSMDESSDEEDEETPKKVESSKNRPVETATPASKKAKSAVSPQKSDGKKGGHTATPHPGKQAGKNSAKTPKSGGLGSHKKAKHGGK